MHVLLDARCILGRLTGDRTYWLGLLGALPRVAPDWRFTAALDAPPPAGLLPEHPNLAVTVAESPRGRLWTQVALPRLAARLGADLVHVQYTGPLRLPCPFVTTVHDCSFELFPETFPARDRWLLQHTVPWTCRRAGAVIGVSDTTRLDLLRLYRLPIDRVYAAPNGIGPEFRPVDAGAVRAAYGLPERYVLSLGVLQPRKNLGLLLRALAIARERGFTWPLAVAGKLGWGTEALFAQLDELRLRDQVRLLGYVPDEDLPGLYSGATLFAYPSLYEGFGLPPLEAAACGCPPLVSTTPALVEVTGPDLPHLPPDDPEPWAAALLSLAADQVARGRLAAIARRRAAEFTWERSAAAHLLAYRRARRP